ncbi:MAG: hypothetical protein JW889_10700 [Verrucomicrobia bacterium]|nr:hypothetical protein [Verrucomicrobiota bacterium]
MAVSYVLAIWCTLGLAVLFSGLLAEQVETEKDLQALGVVIWWLIMVPSLIGTALSVSTFDRRLGNPPSVWVAAIWNGLILGALAITTIIGNLTR